MRDPVRPLSGLLAAQVALGLLTWWPSSTAVVSPVPLLPGGVGDLARMEIQGGATSDPVILEREGEVWHLTSEHGFPADASKVSKVLEGLEALTLGSPIATRDTSHDALGVSREEARRIVTWTTKEGDATTAYLSAAGRDRVNLRREGEDAVYASRGMGVFTLRDDARGYLPNRAVDVSPDTLQRFTLARPDRTLTFIRETDTQWAIEGTEDQVASEALADLMKKALSLRLERVLAASALPEHSLAGDGTATVSWSIDGATTDGSYVIGEPADNVTPLLIDGLPQVVGVPTSAVEPLMNTPWDELIAPRPSGEGAPTP